MLSLFGQTPSHYRNQWLPGDPAQDAVLCWSTGDGLLQDTVQRFMANVHENCLRDNDSYPPGVRVYPTKAYICAYICSTSRAPAR